MGFRRLLNIASVDPYQKLARREKWFNRYLEITLTRPYYLQRTHPEVWFFIREFTFSRNCFLGRNNGEGSRAKGELSNKLTVPSFVRTEKNFAYFDHRGRSCTKILVRRLVFFNYRRREKFHKLYYIWPRPDKQLALAPPPPSFLSVSGFLLV